MTTNTAPAAPTAALAAVAFVLMACTRCAGTGVYRGFGVCYRCEGVGTVKVRATTAARIAADAARVAAASAERIEAHRTSWAEAVSRIDWAGSTTCPVPNHRPGFACVCIEGRIPDMTRNAHLDVFADN